jgi:hypothetical protein
MDPGMRDVEMIEDIAQIENEAIKDQVQGSLTINNRAGRMPPLVAEKITSHLHSGKIQQLL